MAGSDGKRLYTSYPKLGLIASVSEPPVPGSPKKQREPGANIPEFLRGFPRWQLEVDDASR
jgi:hypothetical protein